jgi:molecular chaperone DnaJ
LSKRDYYEVLGVSRDADGTLIKKAYRQLAVQFHPDKNRGDKAAEERFKEAAEAYSVLSDPEKRRRYDQFGHRGVGGGGFSGFDPETFSDFGDILGEFFGLGDLFGHSRRSQGPRRGPDLRADLQITLEEAALGKEEELRVPRNETCATCKGSGAADPSAVMRCDLCAGRGTITLQQGFFSFSRTCDRCGGSGRVVKTPCAECEGRGMLHRERALRIKIPAGVDDGSQLRVAGEGEAGSRGGPPGSLYVVIHVAEHPIFQRDGRDIFCELPITVSRAYLGGEVPVKTLDGVQRIRVPGGAQTGTRVKIKGKGLPAPGSSSRGDQIVVLRVVVPRSGRGTKAMDELFRQLESLEGEEPSAESRDFLDRVKDFFA